MKKLLTLILILFAAPCFGDTNPNCRYLTFTSAAPIKCSKGEVMIVLFTTEDTTSGNQSFIRNFCDFNYAIVLSSDESELSCVYRGKKRDLGKCHASDKNCIE